MRTHTILTSIIATSTRARLYWRMHCHQREEFRRPLVAQGASDPIFTKSDECARYQRNVLFCAGDDRLACTRTSNVFGKC